MNENNCFVTALLSLVPAKPMASLETPRSLDIILTSLFVSQLRQVTVATVYSPSTLALGGSEISVTLKSSGSVLRWPPVPSVSQRYFRMPTPASAVVHVLYKKSALEVLDQGVRGLLEGLHRVPILHLDHELPVHELWVLIQVPDEHDVLIVLERLHQGGDEREVRVLETDGRGV